MRNHRKAVQERFVEAVRSGVKRTTIRPVPNRDQDIPNEGDSITLFRWTGKPYRSKQEVIGEFRILRVWSASVYEHGIILRSGGTYWIAQGHGGDKEVIAKREGFNDWAELAGWFRREHGLTFTGIMIEWGVFP